MTTASAAALFGLFMAAMPIHAQQGISVYAETGNNLAATDASFAACEDKLVELVAPESIVKNHSTSITDPFWIGSFAPFKCKLEFEAEAQNLEISGAPRPDIKRLRAVNDEARVRLEINRRDAQIIVSEIDQQKIVARRLRKVSGVPILFEAYAPSLPAAHAFLDATSRLDLGKFKIARKWKLHVAKFSKFDEFKTAPGFYQFSFADEPFENGVISDTGTIVLKPGFQMISATPSGFIVRTNNRDWSRWGLYSRSGEVLLPLEYRTISDEAGDHARVWHKGGGQQIFDVNAQRFLGDKYEDIDFIDGLDLVILRKDKEYRFATRELKPAIEGVFSRIMKITHDRFVVRKDGMEALIDGRGQRLLELDYNRLWPHFSHGLLYARQGDASMYFDYNGNPITPLGWTAHYAPSSGKGHITVSDPEGRFGVLRKDGSVLIEPQFSQAFQFREGYLPAAIRSEDGEVQLFGLIDENAETAIPFEYEVLQLVFDGRLWAKKNGKWGLIAVDQSVVADFSVDEISRHRKIYDRETRSDVRLMVAKRDGRYGILRHDTGEIVVPFEFTEGRPLTLELRRGDEWLSYPCGFGLDGDTCKQNTEVLFIPTPRPPSG